MSALLLAGIAALVPALLWLTAGRSDGRRALGAAALLGAGAFAGAWLVGDAPWAERDAGSIQQIAALGGIAVATLGRVAWKGMAPRHRGLRRLLGGDGAPR